MNLSMLLQRNFYSSASAVAIFVFAFSFASNVVCPCAFCDSIPVLNSEESIENYQTELERHFNCLVDVGIYQNTCNHSFLKNGSISQPYANSPNFKKVVEYLNENIHCEY